MTILELLDYAGVAVFAATGALSASRKQLDVIGFLFLAAATGIGGGTFRDVILGAGPVFWVAKPTYLHRVRLPSGCSSSSPRICSNRVIGCCCGSMRIGLAAYSVMGAAKGLAATGSPTVAITTGVMTASAGGILRDLLSGEPSVLLRPEIYVTAALTGAAAFTAATAAGAPLLIASAIGVLSAPCRARRGAAVSAGGSRPIRAAPAGIPTTSRRYGPVRRYGDGSERDRVRRRNDRRPQRPFFRRRMMTSTWAISMPSGGSGRLSISMLLNGMSRTSFSPSTKK